MNDGPRADSAAWLVATLTGHKRTLAVAESLTGGLLAAEFVRVPGASAVFAGGIIAYNTELKHTLLGVDAGLLATHGPVHPDVAAQMALGVRTRLAIGGNPVDIGLSTTGVAGPGPQDGHPAGTVFAGIAIGDRVDILSLSLEGTRETIRAQVVSELLAHVEIVLKSSGQLEGR
ncbi:MAG: damage-inducible protein CinA [Glaciihabitans sp.]|nr:damage-inducible protein CinA [Glaciihabitans sp.]